LLGNSPHIVWRMSQRLAGFGAALRHLRERRRELTLEAFAAEAGLDASDVSKWERDARWPSRASLERLLEGLGVSLLDLAVEVDRQQRKAAGEPLPFPPRDLSEEEFEQRVRQIIREEFRAGIGEVLAEPSSELQKTSNALRIAGFRSDLEAVAALRSLLRPIHKGGGK
jgi:transcriptional regulator with XRE-family HTH domain